MRKTKMTMAAMVVLLTTYTNTLQANDLIDSYTSLFADISIIENETKQVSTYKGIVKSNDGEELIGVTVVNKTTNEGAITGIDGDFTMKGSPGDILTISYVGFESTVVKLGKNLELTIVLKTSNILDEVVVVGYGTQKKANMTGSVASISSESVEGRANADILSSIQGQVPGVTIITRPGSTPSINFRGRGNLGTSSPLFVIDGVIVDADFFGSLDPSSIESISFLKDAASSAIYGARAAYGVVLVKTKDGGDGKVTVKYNGNIGIKQSIYTPKVLSSEWYAKLSNEAALNENPNLTNLPYNNDAIEKYANGTDRDRYPNTNWYDIVLDKEAVYTQHSISISGSGKTKYNTVLGYTYNEGFTRGQTQNRFNFATNLASDVTKWLTFKGNIKYIHNVDDRPNGGVTYLRLLSTPSTYVAKQSNGEYGTMGNGTTASTVDMQRNPLRILEQGGWQKQTRKNLLLNVGGDVKILEDLKLTGEFSYRYRDAKETAYESNLPKLKHFETEVLINGTDRISRMDYRWQDNNYYIGNLLLNYNKSYGRNVFTGLLGTSYEYYKWIQSKASRKNFITNGGQDINGGSSAPGDMTNEGGTTENKMMSYFGRLTYSYDEKYLLEANVRADGSSRFHADHRWGTFPSFSAGWRISQENFMNEVKPISNLKVRASWGKLGNINNVGDYDYFSTYQLGGNYNFENSVAVGIVDSKPANQFLTWEKVTVIDFGLDIDLLQNQLGFVVDYYDKKTNDILLGYNVPKEVGVAKPSLNLGSVRNRGIEISGRYNNSIGDFNYSVGVNFSKNTNKILDLGKSDPIYEDPWIKKVGYAIGTFYGYKTNGLLTQDDINSGNYITNGTVPNAGDVKYVDLDGSGTLGSHQRTYLGNDVPDMTYGGNIGVSYLNWDLNISGQGVSNVKTYFTNEMAHAFFDFANPRKFHLQRWTVDNPNPKAGYPRIYPRSSSHTTYNQYMSDYWLFDASYFKVKNITLGYVFPKTMTEKMKVTLLRLYASVENPIIVRGDKRMKDFDPESPSGRGTNSRGVRTYSVGLNLSF